ncbi:MAG: M28 family peptidase, partial [Deltaproteobacteria bacterium]|nr:M28 family peptidase [Deltaproteobacteria bacterium]
LGVARALVAEHRVARPVTFVFTGAEELGLFGSRAYAAAPLRPLAETRAVINLDMVGRRFYEQAVDRDLAIGAVGLGDDAALAAAADRAAARAGLAIVPVSPALLMAIGEGFRGDDWSFRRPGLPAVHFSTGLHDDYHAPSDTAEHIAPAQLARSAALIHALVEELDGEVTN